MSNGRSRRSVLAVVATSATVPALVGATPRSEAPEEPDVVVTVGPDGEPIFDPEEVLVEEGSTVRFEWASGGHTLSVAEESLGEEWTGVSEVQEQGFVHEHTFTESSAEYEFYCEPHREEGMEGTLGVYHGDPEPRATVLVGPDDERGFDPIELSVDPHLPVDWIWRSDDHTIVPTSTPDAAEWAGVPEPHDEGHSYSHEFEVAGVYEYQCSTHSGPDTTARVVVGDPPGGASGTNTSDTGNATDSANASGEDPTPGFGIAVAVGALGAVIAGVRRRLDSR